MYYQGINQPIYYSTSTQAQYPPVVYPNYGQKIFFVPYPSGVYSFNPRFCPLTPPSPISVHNFKKSPKIYPSNFESSKFQKSAEKIHNNAKHIQPNSKLDPERQQVSEPKFKNPINDSSCEQTLSSVGSSCSEVVSVYYLPLDLVDNLEKEPFEENNSSSNKVEEMTLPPVLVNQDINKSPPTELPPLHQAARKGNVHLVRQLLKDPNCDFYEITDKGRTAMSYAIKKGCLEIVKLLVESGYDINWRYLKTPLIEAYYYRNVEITRFLLENNAVIGSFIFKNMTTSDGTKLLVPNRAKIEFLIKAGVFLNVVLNAIEEKMDYLSRCNLIQEENRAEFLKMKNKLLKKIQN